MNIDGDQFSVDRVASNRENPIVSIMKTALSSLRSVVCALALGAVAVQGAQTNSIPANPNPDRLVWIKAGTFTMGSPSTEKERRSNEGPRRR